MTRSSVLSSSSRSSDMGSDFWPRSINRIGCTLLIDRRLTATSVQCILSHQRALIRKRIQATVLNEFVGTQRSLAHI